ncbi:hypothetical protein CAOG_009022, partial [Capsaspora owczarzaki ATCC 30864]
MTGPPKTSGTGPGQPAIASALAAVAQHQQRANRTASPSSQVDMTSNDPAPALPTATSGGNAAPCTAGNTNASTTTTPGQAGQATATAPTAASAA